MNTKTWKFLLGALVALFFTYSASAANITIGGTATDTGGSIEWGGELGLSFEKGNFEFGARHQFSTTESREVVRTCHPRQTIIYERNDWVANTSPFVDYNYSVGKGLTLFAGAALPIEYGSDLDVNLAAGPEVGAKLDVSERTFLFVRAAYNWQITDRDREDFARYGAGLGFRF